MSSALLFIVIVGLGTCQACVPLSPLNIVVNNNTIATSTSTNTSDGEWCGPRLEFVYPRQAIIKEVVVDVWDKCSNSSTKMAVAYGLAKGELVGAWPCTKRILLTKSNTLLLTSTQSNICVKSATAYDCRVRANHRQAHKRSAINTSPSSTKHKQHKSSGWHLLLGLLFCVTLLTIAMSSVTAFLSCCRNKRKCVDEENQLTDNSVNSTHSNHSNGSASTQDIVANKYTAEPRSSIGSVAPPGTPKRPHTPDAPPTPPLYVIPKEAIGRRSLSKNSSTGSSGPTEPLYHTLEVMSAAEDVTTDDPAITSSKQTDPADDEEGGNGQEKPYFVLEIMQDDSDDDSRPIGDQITPTKTDGATSTLGVLSQGLCSVCSKPVENENDTLYLVIIPDKQDQSTTCSRDDSDYDEVASIKDEPVYQVLENPSAMICQSCLVAENSDEPIYDEVEAIHFDDPYEKVKQLIKQSSSPIYSRVESLDVPGYQLSPQHKKWLKDIKIASTSGEYASIASTPPQSFDLSYGLPVFVDVGGQSAIQNFVNTLKSKFKLSISRRQTETTITALEPEAAPTVPPRTHSKRSEDQLDSHHMYMNTGPNVETVITLTQVQMKLDHMVQMNDDDGNDKNDELAEEESASVTPQAPVRNVSLAHSNSQRRQRNKVFIAQRQRSGSYHILNIEDIWKHQLENRYAPVSIIRHRSPSPSKLRKGASLKSRRSYIRDRFQDRQESKRTSVTDYEVPLQMIVPPKVVPPPMVIKRMSQCTLPRQDAVCATDGSFQEAYDSLMPSFVEEEVEFGLGRMVSTTSEPCLSTLSGNDYDYLEDISIPPSSHNSSCMASPSKHPLERFISVHVPMSKHNYSTSDDYDHMWD